jgi:hypothetical protein
LMRRVTLSHKHRAFVTLFMAEIPKDATQLVQQNPQSPQNQQSSPQHPHAKHQERYF